MQCFIEKLSIHQNNSKGQMTYFLSGKQPLSKDLQVLLHFRYSFQHISSSIFCSFQSTALESLLCSLLEAESMNNPRPKCSQRYTVLSSGHRGGSSRIPCFETHSGPSLAILHMRSFKPLRSYNHLKGSKIYHLKICLFDIKSILS